MREGDLKKRVRAVKAAVYLRQDIAAFSRKDGNYLVGFKRGDIELILVSFTMALPSVFNAGIRRIST